jgi:hypothetical protein
MHPLEFGEHLADVLRERGISMTLESPGDGWRGSGDHARTAIEAFVSVAGDPVATDPDDEEVLGTVPNSDLLMFEGFWNDIALDTGSETSPIFRLSFTRQFNLVSPDDEQGYLHATVFQVAFTSPRLVGLEGATSIDGYGGPARDAEELAAYDALPRKTYNGAAAWYEAVAADPTFKRALSEPPDHFVIGQGPI